MWSRLLRTDADYATTIARVALAIVILPHGAQKLLGWFGGGGVSGTIGFFQSALGIPAALTLLVIAAESLGALALIFGVVGRFAAVGIAAVMAGAVFLQHAAVGFFMNWTGAQPGEGFEFHILAIGLAAVVAIKGSGALSIDRLLAARSTDQVESRTPVEQTLRAAA